MAATTTWTSAINDVTPANMVLDNSELLGGAFAKIIGDSAALQRVLDLVRVVGPTDTTVLIQGETGRARK